MIDAFVIDDEWYNLVEITDLLEATGIIKVVGKYLNPLNALEDFYVKAPALVLVDIEMPGIDGLTLAEKLLEIKPGIKIIFVTSWNQYAVQAFDLNALDYIMKPIKLERFNRMIEKIKNDITKQTSEKTKKLNIKCFGQFEVKIGSDPVKWDRSKAEELFAFLLTNNNVFIRKEIIIELLWPGYEVRKALQNLQTSIYKIRSIFTVLGDKVKLDYNQSKYCLSIKESECDLLEVEEVIRTYQAKDRNAIAEVEKAIAKYGSGLLIHQGYLWSMEKDEEIRKKLVEILKDLLHQYPKYEYPKEYLRILRSLSLLLPYEEEIHYQLLTEYKRNGKHVEALSHYQWLVNILKNEYDMTPSTKISRIFDLKNIF